MKFSIGLIVFIVCGLARLDQSDAFDIKWKEKAKDKIESEIKKFKVSNSDLAMYIAGGEGEPIVVYSLHPEKKMIPASISKLVTAAAAVSQFPPGTKFKTQILGSQAPNGTQFKGHIYFKGGGDPSFVSETMWYLVNAFVRTGIKEIDGDIIVDDSLFDKVRIDPSRQKERVDKAYDAPTGAMSFNWNSINVFVRPTKAGKEAEVFADPENEYIRLKGSVKTVSAKSKSEVIIDRDEDNKGPGDIIKVSGTIAEESKEIVVYKNITQPDIWAGYNLKAFLKQRGITLKGEVKAGTTPASAKLLAESDSKPFHDILSDMNKFSNNYIAEMLVKNLAAVHSPPGSIEKGMKYIQDYLRGIGVTEKECEFENPSGLTRKNKVTAYAMWKVINDMKFQFKFQPEFVTSLPIAGIDGTLKNRMKAGVAERWVRAKTGYLDGVVSLAGYAGRKDGTVIPFVFMYNGSVDEAKVRQLFDSIATVLVE